jgi:hypothetical protein
MKSFEVLKAALERSVSHDGPLPGAPRPASVCVLVAESAPTPHICFIRRAQWDGDPWSDHIAFPGGSRLGDETAWPALVRGFMPEDEHCRFRFAPAPVVAMRSLGVPYLPVAFTPIGSVSVVG